jgi:uncharacterized tellurite resistance protein B-like protein
LKAAFNLMWDESLKRNDKSLPYRDMTRIADAVRLEGPGIMGIDILPNSINSSLQFAISAVDPNKARSKENLKKGLAGLSGATGLSLAAVCLGQLLNPGLWAIVVTFFAGGVAGGPLAVFGIGAGLLMVAGGVYAAFQKMTPQERAKKAHEFVMKGIDCWIEKGGDEKIVIEMQHETPSKITNNTPTPEISSDFSENELAACSVILKQVSSVDGKISDEELKTIKDALGIVSQNADITFTDAINLFQGNSLKKRKELVSWCFGVAYVDGHLHPRENDILKKICSDLTVDYNAFLELFSK